jgi:hypothetical protein
MPPLMKCGCVASGTDANGKPVCVACAGINPGAYEVNDAPTDLTGRVAVCSSCGSTVPSSTNLPFFEYRPHMERDSFYNGCRGWD